MSRIRVWLLFARLVQAMKTVPTTAQIAEHCDVTRKAAQNMRREYLKLLA